MTTGRREWSSTAARAVLAEEDADLILPALQAIQSAFGFVPDGAVAVVAEHLNFTRADVYGVLTFYSDLRTSPPADVEVRICLGEACQSVGARELLARTPATPACDVQHVYCLGNCALGPAALVNDRLVGRATAERLAGLVADATRVDA